MILKDGGDVRKMRPCSLVLQICSKRVDVNDAEPLLEIARGGRTQVSLHFCKVCVGADAGDVRHEA